MAARACPVMPRRAGSVGATCWPEPHAGRVIAVMRPPMDCRAPQHLGRGSAVFLLLTADGTSAPRCVALAYSPLSLQWRPAGELAADRPETPLPFLDESHALQDELRKLPPVKKESAAERKARRQRTAARAAAAGANRSNTDDVAKLSSQVRSAHGYIV